MSHHCSMRHEFPCWVNHACQWHDDVGACCCNSLKVVARCVRVEPTQGHGTCGGRTACKQSQGKDRVVVKLHSLRDMKGKLQTTETRFNQPEVMQLVHADWSNSMVAATRCAVRSISRILVTCAQARCIAQARTRRCYSLCAQIDVIWSTCSALESP